MVSGKESQIEAIAGVLKVSADRRCGLEKIPDLSKMMLS